MTRFRFVKERKPHLKSPGEIEAMKAAGQLSARALKLAGGLVRPGITTLEIDGCVEEFIRAEGGVPAFKGYGGFPCSICASVNEQVVHGIPSGDVVLKEGDIVSIDTGAIVDGWVGDNAHTFTVGAVAPGIQRLLDTVERALWAGIGQAVCGNHIRDIGFAVQSIAEAAGYSVVRQYTGHGIGRAMHEEPSVPNFGREGEGIMLEEGLVLAIEPIVNMGTKHVHTLEDRWTVVTDDARPSAHFEHTVAVTGDGPVVLTRE
ncbi:MAG: type I methionyl aminopeptidase [Actinomycetota bacterium]|nr:type I methionyl aminopeptidase [Actinomycetota bacterium]